MNKTPVQARYIELNDEQVYVRKWRAALNGDRAPVVLLHDSLGCVDLWREFPERLACVLERDVIAYDRLGFGRSSARTEPPSTTFVKDEASLHFPQLIKALGIGEYIALGHSVGGAMALLIAAGDHNCKAAISISGQTFIEGRTLEGIRAAKAGFADPAVFNRLVKWHDDKAAWVLDAWTETWLSPAFSDYNIVSDLAAIRCPVYAIHGDSDEYGSVAFPESIVESAGGSAQMTILKDCGHVPYRECPEEVLELINSFLADKP